MVNGMTALFALAGAISGFMITVMAEKITTYKLKKTGGVRKKDRRFTKVTLRGMFAVADAAVWAAAGCLTGSFIAAVLVSLLIELAQIIALVDMRIRIIPNELVLSIIVLGVCFQIFCFGPAGAIIALACMVVNVVVFTLVGSIVGLTKIGAGDVKLIGAVGLALGYPYVMAALVIMSLTIIFYCVFGIVTRKLKRTSMFPFAPFIMFGMVSSLVLMIVQNGGHFTTF